jgi:hypothetical protein
MYDEKGDGHPNGTELDMAFTYAEKSAGLGHFSQACALLAQFMDGFRKGELDKKGPKSFESVDKFLERI